MSMEKAEGDRVAADVLFSAARPELWSAVCFHCQQEAEKRLKATLVRLDDKPPKTHDLLRLLELLQARVGDLEKLREQARAISDYAVIPRYPSIDSPSETNAREALESARIIRDTLLELC